MFGMDFAKMAELLPQVEAFGKQIVATVDNILAEQKAQRVLLEKIACKVGVEIPAVRQLENKE